MKKKEKTEKQDNTNLPQLPKNWKWVKLGDVAENIQYGYTESANSEKIGPKFLRITDIQDNKVNWDDVPYCKISANDKNKYLLQQGDLLFARTGATVGKSFLIKTEIPESIFASYLIRVRIFSQVNVDYIAFFFHSSNYWEQIKESESGIGQPNVNGTKLAQLTIPLPPLSEQQRIVKIIEEKFSEIDHGIEKLKLVHSQLKMYRQSVLKAAFEGKLGLGDETTNLVQEVLKGSQENVTPSSKKSEATASSKKPIAPLTKAEIADLPQLPKNWKWVKLGEVVKTIDGDRGKNYPNKNELSSEGYCLFLSTKNVREGRFEFNENIFITKKKDEILRGGKLQIDDVVITTRGTLGNVAVYDENNPFKHVRINSGMLILRQLNKIINNYYLMKFITSPVFIIQLKKKQTGTAQPQIPANILREIFLPLPPSLEIQNAIVVAIDVRLSKVEILEKVVEENLNKAEKLKQSILTKAFQGGLSDQLETDENVEEMLEQLSVEKDDLMKKEKVISEKPKKEEVIKNSPLMIFKNQIMVWIMTY